jgi:peptidoglycan L-alanyl-D-glutamate endopeptidase CwlK
VSRFSQWLFGIPITPYVKAFKREMDAAGCSVRIGEVRRSQERQRELYAQGRTKAGPVVTWTLNSKYVRGRAFDFDFVSFEHQNDDDAWEFAGEVGIGLGLVWGPELGIPDYRHFELPD